MNSTAQPAFRRVSALLVSAVLLFAAARSARAQSEPGNTLLLNGVNEEVWNAHSSSFNRLPLTLTVWINTTQNVAAFKGIVGNFDIVLETGYQIGLRNGQVEAWYSRNGTNYIPIMNGGFVADGAWHHIALMVRPQDARLYLDGAIAASGGWTGSGGVCASQDLFRIGNYAWQSEAFFAGQVEQVSLWNIALFQGQVQDRRRFVPSGSEPGLVASWSFNEAEGIAEPITALTDNFYGYELFASPTQPRALSTAPLGPAPVATPLLPLNVGGGTATLRAAVNPRGVPGTAFFQWTTSIIVSPQSTPATSLGAGTNQFIHTAQLSGLASSSYIFRIVVTNEFGRMESDYQTFQANPPFNLAADLSDATLGSPAWGDFDNDGDLDLVVRGRYRYVLQGSFNNPVTDVFILRNDGTNFAEITVKAEQNHFVFSAAPGWLDFDRDGDLDLFVADDGHSWIYRNDGGVFTPTDVGLPAMGYGNIAWADLDNDGDLDAVLAAPGYAGAKLLENNGGMMSELRVGMPNIYNTSRGSFRWSDYDNDGDMDLVTTGTEAEQSVTRVWRNFFGTLNEPGIDLPDIELGVPAWGDCDSDGNLDIVLSGLNRPPGVATTAVWRNLSNGVFASLVVVPSALGLPDLQYSIADWGDFDGDGDQDLAFGGSTLSNAPVAGVYRFTPSINPFFADIGLGLPASSSPTMEWGDFDQDGQLDFALSGSHASEVQPTLLAPTRIYRNRVGTNTPPSAPNGLAATLSNHRRVDFSWSAGTDARTPAAGLTYNLRVGTTPGSQNVLAANADSVTGRRLLSGPGNVQVGTTHFLHLPSGTYYWSVQTVDSGFAASAFAPEQSFTITAPVEADCGPLTALQFDGVDDNAQVAHAPALNAYPMTITAWVRTSQETPDYRGIVCKYEPGSGNGYSMHLFNGRLCAWYFRDGANKIYPGDPGIDGGFIADGQWHHVAFAITSDGGALYVDGAPRASLPWTGSPGPATSPTSLRIGRYLGSAQYFAGSIDDVAIWNQGLRAGEIQALVPQRLTGKEAGLIASWNLNEGIGTTADDVSAHGNFATLLSGPAWVPSGAAICGPLVRTVAPTELWASVVFLIGQVNPQGSDTTAWFDYGPTPSYGSTTAQTNVGAGQAYIDLSARIANLFAAGTYHFRLVASNRFGRINGQDLIFTVPAHFALLRTISAAPNQSLALVQMAGFESLDLVSSSDLGFFGLSGPLFENFGAWRSYGTRKSPVAPGDFDNNGSLDLIFVGGTEADPTRAELARNYSSSDWFLYDVSNGVAAVQFGAAAWADFDNDGDLDLATSGFASTGVVCRVYRNDAGWLGTIAAELPGVSGGALAWGDYDNDEDLDLLVTGSPSGFLSGGVCRIYRNDNGVFVNLGRPLTGASFNGDAAWHDFDNDGDLDFVVGGWSPSIVPHTTIYRNDGEGVFTNINAGLPGIGYGSLAWADYDSDGLTDLLLTGASNAANDRFTRVYRQNPSGNFALAQSLPGVMNSDVVWGDCFQSGTLDFIVSGRAITNGSEFDWTALYRGQSTPNHAPTAPAGLTTVLQSNRVMFLWNAATDAETPAIALTYNLRVGTTPGGWEIMSPPARLPDGLLFIPAMGNVQLGTNAWLRLPPGTYYWSVQAVDNGFLGSPFAPEQSFTVVGEIGPTLSVRRTPTNSVVVSWPSPSPEFALQQSASLNPPNWVTPSETITDNGTNKFIIVNPPTENRFYRLFRP
jgi:hypothetical protein